MSNNPGWQHPRSYISSAGHSSRRSSRMPDGFSRDTFSVTRDRLSSLRDASRSGWTAVEVLVDAIYKSGVPGPVLLTDYAYIGQGTQFVVSRQYMQTSTPRAVMQIPVAVKQPKFDIGFNTQISLATKGTWKHLHDFYLEIMSLTTSSLSVHPNIVKLLAWSKGDSFHWPPLLVMELAEWDLNTFLTEQPPTLEEAYRICCDVAAGLDALHEIGLVHGDIKPANILIFPSGHGPVAKLADFALSTDEVEFAKSGICLGGTPGWQAPEVEEGRVLTIKELVPTDSYSFGLLAWSILFLSGRIPPRATIEKSHATLVVKDASRNSEIPKISQVSTAVGFLSQLLEVDPKLRPRLLCEGFSFNRHKGARKVEEPSGGIDPDDPHGLFVDRTFMDRNLGQIHDWEPHPLSVEFAKDIYDRFQENKRSVPLPILFPLCLALTVPNLLDIQDSDRLSLAVSAASAGHAAAQAALPDLYQYYKRDPGQRQSHILTRWLKNAVSKGVISARAALGKRDPKALDRCVRYFHDKGGFNELYSPHVDEGFSALHFLATYRTMYDLREYFRLHPRQDIEQMTSRLETPLYLACARGSWDIIEELLNLGASASPRCTPYHISCIHWTFALGEQYQAVAVKRLIDAGGDINSVASKPVPLFYYPFHLPAGTALHWAVVTSSCNAIKVLVQDGAADALIRDGCDPYIHDERVRCLNQFGGSNLEQYSFSKVKTQGLSPLDYAAMQHDPYIFELLLSVKRRVDINAVDEEGLNVFHRLSHSQTWYTRRGLPFSSRPFLGNAGHMRSKLGRTVKAIKALGGDIDLLSTPNQHNAQGFDFSCPSMTPLMMAVSAGLPDVVEALLAAGADIHKQNEQGRTAISFVPFVDGKMQDQVYACVSALLHHGADPDHRSYDGLSAVFHYASTGFIHTTELLLSKCKDIDQRHPVSGQSIFAKLARIDSPFRQDNDAALAQILAGHLFNHTDKGRLRWMIEDGDFNGDTLLHRFVFHCMPICVQAAIAHGAPLD
ncbi:ankyrin repeat and protein kinase domain-containing protein [Aspergillus aculeatinus CBS 121060]|uniref:Uncharacterized protein n=1 Tax=Aspergillus aculeatinus CBS 121060 TaxID=1448322 RepID=A0ACD1H150_9EURO|nr:hypothetical protein BO66DRAFT_473551 [Aspergillus aculeatinus CBS 121060]RAH67303.1 hypothetical protein BO66DRAFT_473551 [Aspergillus aculeatinus CBS 121060]